MTHALQVTRWLTLIGCVTVCLPLMNCQTPHLCNFSVTRCERMVYLQLSRFGFCHFPSVISTVSNMPLERATKRRPRGVCTEHARSQRSDMRYPRSTLLMCHVFQKCSACFYGPAGSRQFRHSLIVFFCDHSNMAARSVK